VVAINILHVLNNLEARQKNTERVILAALRSWQAVRFLEPEHEMRTFLQRANHAVIAAHRKNLVHIRLYALAIFIAIETAHYDSANEMLDKAMSYKSFLRNNEPLFYGALCFLYAYLELNQRRIRSAKKYRNALADHIKNAPPSPFYNVMQGLLHLAANEFHDANKFLDAAFEENVRSIFLYEGLFRFYKNFTREINANNAKNILPVLIYAAERGAQIGDLAAKFSEQLSAAIKSAPEAGEKLYELSNYPPLLKDICSVRIAKNDMSPEAFAYYRDAEKKQIYTPELFGALIRAAYENNSQRINHYPVKKFLHAQKELSDLNFAVYIYHFLLTDPTFSDLLFDFREKILELGARYLEKKIRGREANSVYYFLWRSFRAKNLPETIQIEEILRDYVTLFEMRAPEKVKFVYVTEPEKRGMKVHEISGFVTIIEAVNADAKFTCLGAGQREILDEKIVVTPMIGGSSPDLYLHFFEKGDRRFNLLAYLANYFLRAEKIEREAAPIFEAILKEKIISKPYKMRILVALGRLHYDEMNFEKALKCYGEVDESVIQNDFLEQILNVYLQTKEYTRAAKLICAKHKNISGEILFGAMEKFLENAENSRVFSDSTLSEVAYNLLAENFFSEELLDFVLKNHNASYTEWANLSQVIDEDNRTAFALDAKVLESALCMASFDKHAQKAFVRLYSRAEIYGEILEKFTELATFEMLANQSRPSYDVLTILEKNYTERNVLLAWALATVYLRYNITTFKSEKIIRFAILASENEGILFPVFKEAASANPFVEKFQPFLYRSLPEKNCKLYYKIDGKEYASLAMQYVRYGLYVAIVPMFYNESFTYFFSEESATGSVTTKELSVTNAKPFLCENSADEYFVINNAIIYEQMFKHDRVEKLISKLVKDIAPVRARIL